jgi:mRNA interferase RelE/StbE
MEKYKITIKKSAAKELEAIPGNDLQRIIEKIQNLSINPRPPGVQKLSSLELYRIRQGNYRIIYTINDSIIEIVVIKIGHRKDIYNF